jgi:hypothetical protein
MPSWLNRTGGYHRSIVIDKMTIYPCHGGIIYVCLAITPFIAVIITNKLAQGLHIAKTSASDRSKPTQRSKTSSLLICSRTWTSGAPGETKFRLLDASISVNDFLLVPTPTSSSSHFQNLHFYGKNKKQI